MGEKTETNLTENLEGGISEQSKLYNQAVDMNIQVTKILFVIFIMVSVVVLLIMRRTVSKPASAASCQLDHIIDDINKKKEILQNALQSVHMMKSVNCQKVLIILLFNYRWLFVKFTTNRVNAEFSWGDEYRSEQFQRKCKLYCYDDGRNYGKYGRNSIFN